MTADTSNIETPASFIINRVVGVLGIADPDEGIRRRAAQRAAWADRQVETMAPRWHADSKLVEAI